MVSRKEETTMTRTIGKLAREAGVHVETIRYYERKGYLDRPDAFGGYRQYSDEAVALVRLLKVAQSMGFTLREVRCGLDSAVTAASFCGEIRRLAGIKHGQLLEQRRALDERISSVERFIHDCAERDPSLPCPIAQQLGLKEAAAANAH
jgi:MerR family transcriptional regulator, mercuric resistance operon regulatory protein